VYHNSSSPQLPETGRPIFPVCIESMNLPRSGGTFERGNADGTVSEADASPHCRLVLTIVRMV